MFAFYLMLVFQFGFGFFKLAFSFSDEESVFLIQFHQILKVCEEDFDHGLESNFLSTSWGGRKITAIAESQKPDCFLFVWTVDFNISCIKKISPSNISGSSANGGPVTVMFKGLTEVTANGSLALRVKLTDCNPDGVVEGHKNVLAYKWLGFFLH